MVDAAKFFQQFGAGFWPHTRNFLQLIFRLLLTLQHRVVAHCKAVRLVADALEQFDDVGCRESIVFCLGVFFMILLSASSQVF